MGLELKLEHGLVNKIKISVRLASCLILYQDQKMLNLKIYFYFFSILFNIESTAP